MQRQVFHLFTHFSLQEHTAWRHGVGDNGGNLPLSPVPHCSRDTSGQILHSEEYLPSRRLVVFKEQSVREDRIREVSVQAATCPAAYGRHSRFAQVFLKEGAKTSPLAGKP